jgi:hypothetical protein
MKAGIFLLIAMATSSGCAPVAEVGQNAPPAAAPQSLLPAEYSAPPAAAAPTGIAPRPIISASPIYAAAPAWRGQGVNFPATSFSPYHPQWTINVQ